MFGCLPHLYQQAVSYTHFQDCSNQYWFLNILLTSIFFYHFCLVTLPNSKAKESKTIAHCLLISSPGMRNKTY